jgi:hypothetical protein
LTNKYNIAIGNTRSGYANDIDLYCINTSNITFGECSSNVFNKAVVSGGSLPQAGFDINAAYTYTHSSINFDMEGNLPKLYTDWSGVGYLKYNYIKIHSHQGFSLLTGLI